MYNKEDPTMKIDRTFVLSTAMTKIIYVNIIKLGMSLSLNPIDM